MGSVWVGRASGGSLRRITSGVWAVTPAWSPDSQWIAFAQVRDSNSNGRSDENDAVDIWAVPLAGETPCPWYRAQTATEIRRGHGRRAQPHDSTAGLLALGAYRPA